MATAPKFRTLRPPVASVERKERSASERGYGHYWTTVVAPAVRERDEWLCQMCLKEGGLAHAMAEMASRTLTKNGNVKEPTVDHIIPAHRIPESKFYDEDNLQTLCDRHHAEKTVDDLKKYGAARR